MRDLIQEADQSFSGYPTDFIAVLDSLDNLQADILPLHGVGNCSMFDLHRGHLLAKIGMFSLDMDFITGVKIVVQQDHGNSDLVEIMGNLSNSLLHNTPPYGMWCVIQLIHIKVTLTFRIVVSQPFGD